MFSHVSGRECKKHVLMMHGHALAISEHFTTLKLKTFWDENFLIVPRQITFELLFISYLKDLVKINILLCH